jgi:hypothetical protein
MPAAAPAQDVEAGPRATAACTSVSLTVLQGPMIPAPPPKAIASSSADVGSDDKETPRAAQQERPAFHSPVVVNAAAVELLARPTPVRTSLDLLSP